MQTLLAGQELIKEAAQVAQQQRDLVAIVTAIYRKKNRSAEDFDRADQIIRECEQLQRRADALRRKYNRENPL